LIAITQDARQFIERWRTDAGGARCFLVIHWRKGEMENRRGAAGEAIWQRLPDPGWEVEVLGAVPEQSWEMGHELMPGVRVAVGSPPEHPFPGGLVIVEDGQLKVRAMS
jgi:hypothetical protein